MEPQKYTLDIDEIKNIVRGLNKAWIEKQFDKLYSYFHEDVIALPPGSLNRISGREAMVDSYRQFVNAAIIHNFEEINLLVNVFNNTAIADLTFLINYEIDKKIFAEKGSEILILNKNDNEWKIVWRTQIPRTSDEKK